MTDRVVPLAASADPEIAEAEKAGDWSRSLVLKGRRMAESLGRSGADGDQSLAQRLLSGMPELPKRAAPASGGSDGRPAPRLGIR